MAQAEHDPDAQAPLLPEQIAVARPAAGFLEEAGGQGGEEQKGDQPLGVLLHPAAQRDLPGKPEDHLRDQEDERARTERRQGCTGSAMPPEAGEDGTDQADRRGHRQAGGGDRVERNRSWRDGLGEDAAVSASLALAAWRSRGWVWSSPSVGSPMVEEQRERARQAEGQRQQPVYRDPAHAQAAPFGVKPDARDQGNEQQIDGKGGGDRIGEHAGHGLARPWSRAAGCRFSPDTRTTNQLDAM